MKLIGIKEVQEMTTLSSSTIWRETKAGRFPKNHIIGKRRVAWLLSDIEAWIEKVIK